MNKKLNVNTGSKVTKHKMAILKLFQTYKHLDATKIHALLNIHESSISIATIYRILSNFEASKVIVKHNFNEDQAVYELILPDEHHDHLICTKCHKVVEFFNKEIENIQEQIAKEKKFKIESHNLNLYGICEDCQIK